MSKMIKDSRGSIRYWIRNENSFTSDCIQYERDEDNGRCYMLVDSCDLRPEMDGALVKKRISKREYDEAFREVSEAME